MAKKFYYGGQAVIEGVMMRGRKSMVTTVRRPSGGLVTDAQTLPAVYSGRMRKIPLLRGIIVLIEAMVLGIKSLLYSANVSLEEEGEKISGGLIWVMVSISLLLAIALFFMVPLLITKLIDPYISSSLLFNLIEGGIRAVIFVLYLNAVALVPDIKRVFAYHGAEHKTVNAYEDGIPLELTAVSKYHTAHARCGTSFLFSVLVIAIVVFALVGRPSIGLMVLSRILLIPVIAALGFEVIYFGAGHLKNALVRAMVAPGLWLQSLTTREPDDNQLEVAITALKRVVEIDQEETGEA